MEIRGMNHVSGIHPVAPPDKAIRVVPWKANYIRNVYMDRWSSVFFPATDLDLDVLEGIYIAYIQF